jgi:hypothetical protein
MATNQSMWAVLAGYSITVLVATSLEEAQMKYLKALNLPNDVIKEKPGYFPGSYAEENILGKHEADHRCYSPWVKSNGDGSVDKLEYSLDNLNKLMEPAPYGSPLISFKSVPMDDMVLTSHLDG